MHIKKVFIVLTMSDLTDGQIIMEMKRCYDFLKSEFFSGNAVQFVSHLLKIWRRQC
ncbi:DUF4003 family protein [Aminipila terrae]